VLSLLEARLASWRMRGARIFYGHDPEFWQTVPHAPRQGSIAVRLQLGSATPWCAEGPAKATGKPPVTVRNDKVDRFTARPETPAADQCPILGSPIGAFLE
jgi:hypothetical protein